MREALDEWTAGKAERSEPDVVLEAVNLSKRFGATQALAGASIELRRGAVHILLGENGAGKSTLAKVVAGIHRPDEGSITVEGRAAEIRGIDDARRLGIGMVFQELSLAPHLSVVDNVFLGSEAATCAFSMLDRRDEARRCRGAFDLLDPDIPLDRPVSSLSVAQKQMVEIAKVLVRDPKIIIMDEPTSTLTEREKRSLFRVIASLTQRGVAILYVTHHLREVAQIGNVVSAMVDGRITETRAVTPELTEAKLLSMLTGREAKTFSRSRKAAPKATVLSIADLRTKTGCNGVGLTVGRGEVVGVYGVVGCGRESLGRVLVGIEPPLAGNLVFDGHPYRPRHPAHARKQGVGLLPMDRKEKGILAVRSIRDNLNLLDLRRFSTAGGFISSGAERSATITALRDLLVRYGSPEKPITTLSGGNQQKVLFGRAVAGRPKLVVMEDPTAGIDMGAKADLYELMSRLGDDGVSFLVFSSDLPETLSLCDRLYTMYAGRIVREFPEPSLADEPLILADVLGQDVYESDNSTERGNATGREIHPVSGPHGQH